MTVDDFTAAYNLHDAAIRKAIPAFAEKQGAANLIAEQDVIPHLSYMQSLLSKKGSNHDIVIAARKAMGNHAGSVGVKGRTSVAPICSAA
jgi:hypothetical protein